MAMLVYQRVYAKTIILNRGSVPFSWCALEPAVAMVMRYLQA